MTTEQKAQAYDEAIERAKKWRNAPNVDKIPTYANRVIEEIFPELKESDEERIRKEIVDFINRVYERQALIITDEERDNWITWLEKQTTPQVRTGLEWVNTIDDACDKRYSEEYAHGEYCHEQSFKWGFQEGVDWLEKQGKETSWKPSKEEMDVLYGLAYITNQYDEHKEEVITRLYQDLKREFFNGSSYENMFPTNTCTEDDVRRRSTIQVLEYARSLDTYNQYGKADIDKNIAWLEKQGESTDINPSEFDLRLNKLLKQFETLPKEELVSSLSFYLNVVQNDGTYKADEKQDEQKPVIDFKAKNWYVSKVDGKIHDMTYNPTDRVETKFKIGDWIITPNNATKQIKRVTFGNYCFTDETFYNVIDTDNKGHLWTIQDAKDGDVLATDKSVFIYAKVLYNKPYAYCGVDKFGVFKDNCLEHDWANSVYNIHPATKEQRDIFFTKMKESGYEWDSESKKPKKKELKKIEQKSAWSEEDEDMLYKTTVILNKLCAKEEEFVWSIDTLKKLFYWLKSIKDRVQLKQEWSEEDIRNIENIDSILFYDKDLPEDTCVRLRNWLKSLKPQNHWKPNKEQIRALHDLNLTGNISYAGQGQVLIELYNDLEKLTE